MSDRDPLARKRALHRELLAHLEAQLATARAAHDAAIDGATHEQARPENDKDTRGLEQSYLARGQAMRVEDLEAAVLEVGSLAPPRLADGAPAALGALVETEEEPAAGAPTRRRAYYLAPHGGGLELDGGAVLVVTPRSPLGRALLGKRAGDDAEVALPRGRRALSIVAVT